MVSIENFFSLSEISKEVEEFIANFVEVNTICERVSSPK